MLETDQIETKNIINIKLMWKMFRSFWYDEEGDQNHVIRVFFFSLPLYARQRAKEMVVYVSLWPVSSLSLSSDFPNKKKKELKKWSFYVSLWPVSSVSISSDFPNNARYGFWQFSLMHKNMYVFYFRFHYRIPSFGLKSCFRTNHPELTAFTSWQLWLFNTAAIRANEY